MKTVLTIFLILIGFAANAQESSRNNFGLSAGAGLATVLRTSLEGSPGLELERDYELGVNYFRRIGKRLEFETGLFYHYNRLIQKSDLGPDIPQITTQYDVHLLYFPAFLRYNLSKNIFVNGGPLVDIDLSNSLDLPTSRALNSQSGLGAGIGIGGEVALLPNLYLQLNPYLNIHGLVPVQREHYPGRILDAGIKIGIRIR